MKTVKIHNAKKELSTLIQQVLEGEEIVITESGKPLVKLVPYKQVQKRKPGAWKGKVTIGEDFDELPKETLFGFTGQTD